MNSRVHNHIAIFFWLHMEKDIDLKLKPQECTKTEENQWIEKIYTANEFYTLTKHRVA